MRFKRRVYEINKYKCISLPVKTHGLVGKLKIKLLKVYRQDGSETEINLSFFRYVDKEWMEKPRKNKPKWVFIPKIITDIYGINKGDYVEVEVTPIKH